MRAWFGKLNFSVYVKFSIPPYSMKIEIEHQTANLRTSEIEAHNKVLHLNIVSQYLRDGNLSTKDNVAQQSISQHNTCILIEINIIFSIYIRIKINL